MSGNLFKVATSFWCFLMSSCVSVVNAICADTITNRYGAKEPCPYKGPKLSTQQIQGKFKVNLLVYANRGRIRQGAPDGLQANTYVNTQSGEESKRVRMDGPSLFSFALVADVQYADKVHSESCPDSYHNCLFVCVKCLLPSSTIPPPIMHTGESCNY